MLLPITAIVQRNLVAGKSVGRSVRRPHGCSPVDAGRSVRGARNWAVRRLRGKGSCHQPACCPVALARVFLQFLSVLKMSHCTYGCVVRATDIARADGKFDSPLLEVFGRGLPKVRLGKQTGTSANQGSSGAEFGSIEVRSFVDNTGRVFARDCSGSSWRRPSLAN